MYRKTNTNININTYIYIYIYIYFVQKKKERKQGTIKCRTSYNRKENGGGGRCGSLEAKLKLRRLLKGLKLTFN